MVMHVSIDGLGRHRLERSYGLADEPWVWSRAGCLEGPGFSCRVRGDHHIFTRDDVEEILNLQPKSGMAKVYQAD